MRLRPLCDEELIFSRKKIKTVLRYVPLNRNVRSTIPTKLVSNPSFFSGLGITRTRRLLVRTCSAGIARHPESSGTGRNVNFFFSPRCEICQRSGFCLGTRIDFLTSGSAPSADMQRERERTAPGNSTQVSRCLVSHWCISVSSASLMLLSSSSGSVPEDMRANTTINITYSL